MSCTFHRRLAARQALGSLILAATLCLTGCDRRESSHEAVYVSVPQVYLRDRLAAVYNKGELVIPVLVTGTFQEPKFAPDLQKIAQMKLQNLVPGLDNPAGLTNGILGQILRGKPAPGEPQQAPNQQQDQNKQPQPDPLKDLFDSFKKKQ